MSADQIDVKQLAPTEDSAFVRTEGASVTGNCFVGFAAGVLPTDGPEYFIFAQSVDVLEAVFLAHGYGGLRLDDVQRVAVFDADRIKDGDA